MKKYQSNHLEFWRSSPALLTGITLLSGMHLCIFSLIWALYLIWLEKFRKILLIGAAFCYAFLLHPKDPTSNVGYFSISSVQNYKTSFQNGYSYHGNLYIDGQKIPCTALHCKENAPIANQDYRLQGTFIKQKGGSLLCKKGKWTPIPKSKSFAHRRYLMKEALRKFLYQKISKKRAAGFLSSLLTGDVEDNTLRFEFGRLGLQHILAISGFHFAILLLFCSRLLRNIFSEHWLNICLLFFIVSYFLFVGNLPAVQRSALFSALYLIAKLIKRNARGLNLLGVALIVEILSDPLVIWHLGFQLSFLSCFGILFFRRHLEPLSSILFPKHKSLHLQICSNYFKEALFLSISVNLAILPLLLFHFHSFPLISFLYNLFIPLAVTLALTLFLSSVLLLWIWPLISIFFFAATGWFTEQILDIISFPPPALQYNIGISYVPGWAIPLYLFALFCLTISGSFDRIHSFYGDRSSVG